MVSRSGGDSHYRNDTSTVLGHLYGAVIASVRDYIEAKKRGRYGATWPTAPITSGICPNPCTALFAPRTTNKRSHSKTDKVVNDGILDNLEAIKVYPIEIKSEENNLD
jgi:hypothetical protein